MMTVILFTVLNRMHQSISLLHQILNRVLVFMTGFLKPLYLFREPIISLRFKPDKVCQLVLICQDEILKLAKYPNLASIYGKDN